MKVKWELTALFLHPKDACSLSVYSFSLPLFPFPFLLLLSKEFPRETSGQSGCVGRDGAKFCSVLLVALMSSDSGNLLQLKQ